ncbi:Na-translocating system protein MpsC family protein [Alkalihalobacillus sp. LMS39]|uniref:Na-translocating system protein MpsC family protein n=1 Tax=Alkalihalobacillus sp. LMS39 TaxID=2924032 RepID=UPI001FB40226|nr:Na-translocating system protein MpsC family protein [Alkalihalobacillus sp. LMS39]UOE94012.1 DUF2294 domain-containing protein [Alkalihalobacillus sp. LMS39]
METIQEKLKTISSYTSKVMRTKFGRGPQLCYAVCNHGYLFLFIKGFISPLEVSLREQKQTDMMVKSRLNVVDGLLSELRGMIQITLQCEVEECYTDWNYENDTGMITMKVSEEVHGAPFEKRQYNEAELISEINRISAYVQKTPEKTVVYQLSPKVFLCEREGILILIEQAFIQKGYEQMLRITKAELEKTHFHHSEFKKIFREEIQDIFVDWDFNKDNSVLCFVLE